MSRSGKPDPKQLKPEFHERIWGSFKLEPLFPDQQQRIGEVWFREPDSTVLVKFLFTTDNLSVQVHPDDTMARARGFPRGKTEMWHVLRNEPGAQIALGFREKVTREQVRAAALDGTVSGLLRWIPVAAGQTWFIPAGTVHALGSGITVCEVQQNSDLTYRLFDYGRGRELHLEEALQALNCETSILQPSSESEGNLLSCPYFEVSGAKLGAQTHSVQANLAIVLRGAGTLNGVPVKAGETWKLDPRWPLPAEGSAQVLTILTRT